MRFKWINFYYFLLKRHVYIKTVNHLLRLFKIFYLKYLKLYTKNPYVLFIS